MCHVYPFLRLIGAQMYLTVSNTDWNVATCSSPTGGEHITYNDHCFRKSDFS